jgi:hypothetical protein
VRKPGVNKPKVPESEKQTTSPGEMKPTASSGGENPTIPPGGQTHTMSPGGSKPSVSPEEAKPTVSPEGGKETVSPESQRPSPSPGKKKLTLSPGGSKPSISPGEAKPTVSPGGEKQTLSPGGQNPSASPGEKKPTFSPGESKPTMSTAGSIPSILPSVSPEGKIPSASPERKKPTISPEGGQTTAPCTDTGTSTVCQNVINGKLISVHVNGIDKHIPNSNNGNNVKGSQSEAFKQLSKQDMLNCFGQQQLIKQIKELLLNGLLQKSLLNQAGIKALKNESFLHHLIGTTLNCSQIINLGNTNNQNILNSIQSTSHGQAILQKLKQLGVLSTHGQNIVVQIQPDPGIQNTAGERIPMPQGMYI